MLQFFRLPVVVLAMTALFAGCPDECRVDMDCFGDAGLLQCVEGSCQPLPIDDGDGCTDDADCVVEGAATQCVNARCAFKPSCQQVNATVSYVASCTTLGVVRGTGTASTSACVTTFTATGLDADFSTNTQLPVDVTVGQLGLTFADCSAANGSWSAARSAAYSPGCSTGTDVCDIAWRGADRPGTLCVVGVANTCDAGETCAPLSGLADVGVCQ